MVFVDSIGHSNISSTCIAWKVYISAYMSVRLPPHASSDDLVTFSAMKVQTFLCLEFCQLDNMTPLCRNHASAAWNLCQRLSN